MMQNRDKEDEGTTLLTEQADRSCDEDVILEGIGTVIVTIATCNALQKNTLATIMI